MPFIPIRRPRRGNIDHAARRIYKILDAEDREKKRLRDRSRLGQADATVRSGPQVRDTSDANASDQDMTTRPDGRIDEQRAEQLEMQRATRRRRAAEVASQPQQPAPEYGLRDWISDQLSGVGSADYENYVGANAAISEMVGSQLPGRERGPADAYRHLLWSAELTRRFGEQRAREILGLHEQAGDLKGNQTRDEEAMDLHNNEIGKSIGRFARNWQDVASAARKVMSGSAPDGTGAWQANYDTTSTLAPYGAVWLPEQGWAKNPKVENFKPPIGRGPPLRAPQLPTDQTNWYSNPTRPSGPDWVAGYVPDGYRYPYGLPANAVGPSDPQMLRAIGAYRAYIDRLR
jgi:hypothetical protein